MKPEEVFNSYVKNSGGELVSELLPKSPPFDNADYLFRKQQPEVIIAELKCLTEDVLLENGGQEKLESLYESWMNKGLVKPLFGESREVLKDLPSECRNELDKFLGRRIKKIVHKASKQIRETKTYFGLNEAKGLLLLVNDGNYSLESDMVLYLTGKAFAGSGSEINSVVYFTLNMPARMPGVNPDVLVWVQAPREGMPSISSEFLDWLRNEWLKFHEKIVGESIPSFMVKGNELIEQIKFIR